MIGIIAAMESEMAYFKERLEGLREETLGGFPAAPARWTEKKWLLPSAAWARSTQPCTPRCSLTAMASRP